MIYFIDLIIVSTDTFWLDGRETNAAGTVDKLDPRGVPSHVNQSEGYFTMNWTLYLEKKE